VMKESGLRGGKWGIGGGVVYLLMGLIIGGGNTDIGGGEHLVIEECGTVAVTFITDVVREVHGSRCLWDILESSCLRSCRVDLNLCVIILVAYSGSI